MATLTTSRAGKKIKKKHSFIVNFYTMLAYIYLGLNLRFCLHRNQSCQMIKGRFLLLPERFKLCTMVNMMYTKLNDAQRYQSTFPGLSVADMDYSPFQLAPSENQNMVKPKYKGFKMCVWLKFLELLRWNIMNCIRKLLYLKR